MLSFRSKFASLCLGGSVCAALAFSAGCVIIAPPMDHYTQGNVVREISVTPAIVPPGGEAVIEVRIGRGQILSRGIPNNALKPGWLSLSAGEVYAVTRTELDSSVGVPSLERMRQYDEEKLDARIRQLEDSLIERRLASGYKDPAGQDRLDSQERELDWLRQLRDDPQLRIGQHRRAPAAALSPSHLAFAGVRSSSAADGEQVCLYVLRAPDQPGSYGARFTCPQGSGIGELGITDRDFTIEVR